MKVIITNSPDTITAQIMGEVDTANAVAFETALQPIYECTAPTVILNCGGLTYISSAGLRVFLIIQKYATTTKRQLVLKSLRPDIYNIFEMTGFTSIFKIE